MLSIDNNGISIFAFTLHWTAVFMVLGAWIAAEFAAWLSRRYGPARGTKPLHIWRGLIWTVLFGLIGARLWFVLFPPQSYIAHGFTTGWMLTNFLDLNQGVIALWSGGLGLFGGLLGGTLGLVFYTRHNHLELIPYLDLAAVALPLAQAIARIGNGFRQDLYGPPLDASWGMLVNDVTQRVSPYNDLIQYPLDTTRFHPVYLYESIALAIIFGIVFVMYSRQHKSGDMVLSYLTLYGIMRFLLEFLRVDGSYIVGINISQLAASLMILAAGVGWMLRNQRDSRRIRKEDVADD